MVLAPTRTISCAVNRHQISIEAAAAGCSPIRDFAHCRFSDTGRRWVWLRFPTAGIRKPLHTLTKSAPRATSGLLPLYPQLRTTIAGSRPHSPYVP
jgi:hypothetical protein